MKKIFFLAAVMLFVLFGSSHLIAEELGGKGLSQSGIGVLIMTDKATYSSGEVITMTLNIFNHTGDEVVFQFSTSQRYDFLIEDGGGNKVWRWSDERMFAQVLGEEKIGPGREEIIYEENYNNRLDAGRYKITGILVDRERSLGATIIISVK